MKFSYLTLATCCCLAASSVAMAKQPNPKIDLELSCDDHHFKDARNIKGIGTAQREYVDQLQQEFTLGGDVPMSWDYHWKYSQSPIFVSYVRYEEVKVDVKSRLELVRIGMYDVDADGVALTMEPLVECTIPQTVFHQCPEFTEDFTQEQYIDYGFDLDTGDFQIFGVVSRIPPSFSFFPAMLDIETPSLYVNFAELCPGISPTDQQAFGVEFAVSGSLKGSVDGAPLESEPSVLGTVEGWARPGQQTRDTQTPIRVTVKSRVEGSEQDNSSSNRTSQFWSERRVYTFLADQGGPANRIFAWD